MPERSNGHAWKACVAVTSPRVRIPLCPPFSKRESSQRRLPFFVGAQRGRQSRHGAPLPGLNARRKHAGLKAKSFTKNSAKGGTPRRRSQSLRSSPQPSAQINRPLRSSRRARKANRRDSPNVRRWRILHQSVVGASRAYLLNPGNMESWPPAGCKRNGAIL